MEFHKEFDPEFDALPHAVQDELLAHAILLQRFGPQLGRPRVDTLNGSRHANMKELRFEASTASGESLSPSIQRGGRFFWFAATSQEGANADSTGGWLRKLTIGLTATSPA